MRSLHYSKNISYIGIFYLKRLLPMLTFLKIYNPTITLYYIQALIPPHHSFAKVATGSTSRSSPILLHQCEGWAVRLGLTSQMSIKTKSFVFIILFTYTILTFVWFLQNIKTYDEPWTDGVKAEFKKKTIYRT
jgi:hypothetical protein